jgi:hypothetical protein
MGRARPFGRAKSGAKKAKKSDFGPVLCNWCPELGFFVQSILECRWSKR